MITIEVYETEDGKRPFEDWFKNVDRQAARKVQVALDRLEGGNTSNLKGVGAGVAELKINFGPGYRVYLGQQGKRLVILLTGGTKKRQSDDIAEAKRLWSAYKNEQKKGD